MQGPTNLTDRVNDLQAKLDKANQRIAVLEDSVQFYARSQESIRQQLVNHLKAEAMPQDVLAKVTAMENRLRQLEQYTLPTGPQRR